MIRLCRAIRRITQTAIISVALLGTLGLTQAVLGTPASMAVALAMVVWASWRLTEDHRAVVRVPSWGLEYGEAKFYGWHHFLHIGPWLIFWGRMTEAEIMEWDGK